MLMIIAALLPRLQQHQIGTLARRMRRTACGKSFACGYLYGPAARALSVQQSCGVFREKEKQGTEKWKTEESIYI